MNIFYLAEDPWLAAQFHCDKHIVKMIVEYAQLLSTAHHVLDEKENPNIYKATHINHPCAVWVRSSYKHYSWLYRLLAHCLIEYSARYGKVHATTKLLSYLEKAPKNIPIVNEWIDPPLAMPDQYKIEGDAVQSYRNYYLGEKASFATWKEPTPKPWWWE